MKKDMTTFEMAQAAYENPGKVFVGRGSEPHSEVKVHWTGDFILDNNTLRVLSLEVLQRSGYIWNEKVEPRKWSGEYDGNMYGWKGGGKTASEAMPAGVKRYRVKWEAEEVL